MASLARRKTGSWIVQFERNGERKTISLGSLPKRAAEEIHRRIEHLIAAQFAGVPVDASTAEWLTRIDTKLAEKLHEAGLIAERPGEAIVTLGEWLETYIASRSECVKPTTLAAWGQVVRDMNTYFGERRPLSSIGRDDAEGFRRYLSGRLSDTTVNKRLGFSRHFFKEAMLRGLILQNPFEGVRHRGGNPRARQNYVTVEDTLRTIEAAPDWVWRTIIALARFGGLRCPSEVLSLRWAGVDWERGQMRVESPKTEHLAGGSFRMVPIFGRLRPFLDEAWEMAREGQTHVIPEDRYLSSAHGAGGWKGSNLRTQMRRIVERAGLQPWPRLFHALRASCETDLAREFPIATVCKWIGNTVSIAARHYVQVTDADFERALAFGAAEPVESSPGALHQALQKLSEAPRNGPQAETERKEKTFAMQGLATSCDKLPNEQREWMGIEPIPASASAGTELRQIDQSRAAPGAAFSAREAGAKDAAGESCAVDADRLLGELIELWPRLRPEDRRWLLEAARERVMRSDGTL